MGEEEAEVGEEEGQQSARVLKGEEEEGNLEVEGS